MMFALVKCRLKPVQQDEANANIELEFVGLAAPAFLASYCPQVVDGSPPRRTNLENGEQREGLRRRRAGKSTVCTENEGKHEGRQSLQVCYNLGA